jgi:hypothetical protein
VVGIIVPLFRVRREMRVRGKIIYITCVVMYAIGFGWEGIIELSG